MSFTGATDRSIGSAAEPWVTSSKRSAFFPVIGLMSLSTVNLYSLCTSTTLLCTLALPVRTQFCVVARVTFWEHSVVQLVELVRVIDLLSPHPWTMVPAKDMLENM